MKRNEMVTIIENIIETELTDYPNSYPGNRTVAEIILRYIEQAGMLPPTTPYAKFIHSHIIQGLVSSPVNEWELEDETK